MLPLSFVANRTFPYDEKLEAARSYLALRGITGPRAIRHGTLPARSPGRASSRRRPALTLIPQRASR